ncbi:TetR/AcrR family transcriptional regulator [Vreelandella boliviensis]|uniref:TetR/AcrR family transcriptional regulator n=1 Tax=Vreelandella boliviensis TaxID=223527 RepID=UPI001B8ACFA8|nr:TetR family transcriptional regulator [Halomonas boliviensis]MBS3669993.1 TetR family transcriptional regulator [Halomonas boliviensis]
MSIRYENIQLESVYNRLVEAGVVITADRGLNAVTVKSVSDEAGVAEKYFLQCFSSKHQFILAMFDYFIFLVEEKIEKYMAEDSGQYGRFTRAYIELSFNSAWEGVFDKKTALAALSVSDPELRAIWSSWLNNMQIKYYQTDGSDHLAMIRMTAEGLWMGLLSNVDIPNLGKVREYLLEATHRPG